MKQLQLFSLFLLIGGAFCHSWISCTDYEEMNGRNFDPAKCRAFARSGHTYTPKDKYHGYESGYAYVPTPAVACRTIRDDVCGYNSEYPMAQYFVGQKVVITHPTKVCLFHWFF